MPYKIAGIDVHKRMLHVVVSDVQVDGEYDFTRRIFGSLPEALRSLSAWLVEQQVQEVVMESTAPSTFPSEKHLSSWVGACPGDEEGAEVNRSRRSPQGNRHMRRILNQAANAAAKLKGSIFEILYRRYVPRLGHNQTIGIIAHKLCRLVWKDLAPRNPLRRTRPRGQHSLQAKAHPKNDRTTA